MGFLKGASKIINVKILSDLHVYINESINVCPIRAFFVLLLL